MNFINTSAFPAFHDFVQISSNLNKPLYTAIHIKTGKKVLISIIPKSSILAESKRKHVFAAIEVLSKLDHPFIADFYGTCEDKENLYILTEYLVNGNLIDIVSSGKKLRDNDIQKVFCQIASAIKYLHCIKNIVHRDLQLKNIHFDEDYNVRISDFGLSKALENEEEFLKTQCGYIPFLAPEIIKGRPYSKPVDIWALGIILYALSFNSMPFYDNSLVIVAQKIINAEPEYPTTLNHDQLVLIQKLLNKDPISRIVVDDILSNQWVMNSRYSYYLTDTFINSAKYSSNEPPDQQACQIILEGGYDIEQVKNDLQNNNNSESLMVYKMIRKSQIVSLLTSSDEIRNMYSMKKGDGMRRLSGNLVRSGRQTIHARVQPSISNKVNTVRQPILEDLVLERDISVPNTRPSIAPVRRNSLPRQRAPQNTSWGNNY